MTSNKLALLTLAAALVTTVVQAVIYGPQLPATVASHFGGGGAADGSMSRTAFLVLILCLQFGLAGLMVGLAAVLGKLPVSMINLPNKDYWFHEDRREDTIARNRSMLNWITALTAILIVLTFQLTIQANLNNNDRTLNMPVFVTGMVIYMLAIFYFCGRSLIYFSNVPKSAAK